MNESSTTIPPSPVRNKEQREGDKSENEKTKIKIGMGYICVNRVEYYGICGDTECHYERYHDWLIFKYQEHSDLLFVSRYCMRQCCMLRAILCKFFVPWNIYSIDVPEHRCGVVILFKLLGHESCVPEMRKHIRK